MEEFVLTAKPRVELGTRAACRFRKEGLVPANIYGHGEENLNVCLEEKEFKKFFEAGHRVAKVVVEGRSEEHVVIKEVQYDALGMEILHVDVARIGRDESITLQVPIEIVGVPHGVSGGGVMEFRHKELKVSGKPGKMPESFEINVESLGLGALLRVRELKTPEGCEILDDPEVVVVAIGEAQMEPEEEEAEVAAESTGEPEVIGRKKEEEDEEETS